MVNKVNIICLDFLLFYANIFFWIIFIFKGQGYTQETDKDILLLDISNDNEYIWKTSFDLEKNNTTTTSPIPPGASILPPPDPEKANIIVSAVIGSAIGIAVTLGSFFLYKRKKHTKKQDGNQSTPQNVKDDEILYIPSEKDSNNQQEILLIPGNTRSTTQQNGEKNEAISEVIVQNAQNAQNDSLLWYLKIQDHLLHSKNEARK